ncbi:PqqD family protein [Terriglobus saanensis]|uniref:PqqD family protein n=1 Tax=Terriglobus saanensis TaxID=870903 RepID=UPI0003136F4D
MANAETHLRTVVNEDGAAILDTKQGTISTLNATGGYVWPALERGESEEAIAASRVKETGAPHSMRIPAAIQHR